mmetsp:Transcript_41941/g.135626  ORF Transcript_41941/g.135626 Transcript_41941/m.135626 type:complete len:220 (+) Transcript_41941:363-1022(+)
MQASSCSALERVFCAGLERTETSLSKPPSSSSSEEAPSSEALVVSSMSSAMSRTCRSIAVFFGLAIVAPITSMKAVTPPRAIASAWNLKPRCSVWFSVCMPVGLGSLSMASWRETRSKDSSPTDSAPRECCSDGGVAASSVSHRELAREPKMPPSRFLAVPLEEEEADVRSVGRGVGPELLSPDTDSGGTALAARCGVASVARKGKWSAVQPPVRSWKT